jgi:NAD(P)-dependent dehydrogenase (short-subunit alcohol dehydrogenase family)
MILFRYPANSVASLNGYFTGRYFRTAEGLPRLLCWSSTTNRICPNIARMDQEEGRRRRIAAVTGASGAIGMAIARQLAAAPGHEVVLICRDQAKAARCVDTISRATGNPHVRYELTDLSRRASIQALAQRWKGPLDVLVNNAAVAPRRRMQTPEGIEMQFATNVLGYFWMIDALTEHLGQGSTARIINVASYWAGGLDLGDLEFKKRRYNNDAAYRQSKQADRMLSVAFAGRLQPLGIRVNACHSGDVNSTLSNDLGFGGHQSADAGATTPVWLAVSEAGGQHTGRYFENQREVACPFARDTEAVEALYAACQSYSA